MLRHERSAPIWLFSFVDLAFLLLIAFTQISPAPSGDEARLTLIEVPQLESPAHPEAGNPSARSWQLRVVSADLAQASPSTESGHADARRAPFELLSPAAQQPSASPTPPISADQLAAALAALHAEDAHKPVLAPHPDARAEDLLVAVGLLGEVWEQGRSAAVRPRPRVAAGPPWAERSASR